MASSRFLLPMLLAVALAGCASDAIHVAQLNTGMTRAQVESLQGKPDDVNTSGDYTALRYGNDFHVILRGDRVIAFGQGTISRYPGSHRYFIIQSDS